MSGRPSVAETMLSVAQTFAHRSTCPRREVGCVLVDVEDKILSVAFNGPPSGWDHCTDLPCPGADLPSGEGLGLCQAIHAEINAIDQCSDITRIVSAYITTEPCIECTKALLKTSCHNIYYLDDYSKSGRALWVTRSSWDKLKVCARS